jgi:NSS family neurotransmitter:Na+ symporter
MARERWDKRGAFIMAAIGSAIGLGNVWRFPYMAYANGGGAFFIPYIIALITTGVPLVALEYYLGIRYQKGPTEAYGFIRKRSNYIGWFALGVSGMITVYYTVIMAWAWRYLAASFKVAWAGKEADFFFGKVLAISEGIGVLGGMQWGLVLGNLLTWIAIFLIIFKGVKVVGKVVNWTVGLPWALLGILIIRGITLKGSGMGLDFYLNPDFSHLADPKVWLAAYGQIFFSLSLGFGIMIAYASYLPKDSDINNNAWVVSFSNCATSFFAGFAIFSTLGYMATATGQPIDQVAGAGVGLAFVTFPTAIGLLPGGLFFKALIGIFFFIMLLTLGIDSAFSLVEAIVTGIKDSFNVKREKAAFWVCFVGFLLGMLYCTKGGLYWLDLVDHWMNWGLMLVGLMEAILIGWFFNIKQAAQDIDSTSEMKMGGYWIACVKYITPAIIIIIMISNVVGEYKAPYGGYPTWALMLGGWVLTFTLFILAVMMQNKNSKADWKAGITGRIIGWLIVYAGLIVTFRLFYQATLSKVVPVIVLVGSVVIGSAVIRAIKPKEVTE